MRMRCADCLEQMVINEAYQLAICPRCDRAVCLRHGPQLRRLIRARCPACEAMTCMTHRTWQEGDYLTGPLECANCRAGRIATETARAESANA